MKSYEQGEQLSDVQRFRDLLNAHFATEKPRRHRPGMGLREHEVFLTPPPTPVEQDAQSVRAIRPNPDDMTPARPRPVGLPEGHRLEVLQTEEDGSTYYTLYYIHEGDIWRRKQFHDVNHSPASVSVDDLDFGKPAGCYTLPIISREDFSREEPVEPQEVADLLAFLEITEAIDPPFGW